MKLSSMNHQSKLILSMMAALLILLPAQPIQVNAEANTNTADPAHIPSSESEPEKQQNNNGSIPKPVDMTPCGTEI